MASNRTTEGRVLVIGLDGATLDLICPWVEEGRLPNLARLMKGGTYGKLESTIPPQTPVAWTSFMTGMNAGKHGIPDYVTREPNSYKIEYINATYRRAKPIWSIVGDRGGRVGVVNVPMTYPPEAVNGFMISGMDTPGTDATFMYPPDLYGEITEKFGDYIIDTPIYPQERIHTARYIQEVCKLTEYRSKITMHLMRNYPWDLFVVVFVAPDRIQHDFWRYIDPMNPDFDSRKTEVLGSAIYTIYSQLDDVIGRMTKEVGEEVNIIIMSDHGAGPSYKVIALNEWLRRKGYLRLGGGFEKKKKDILWKLGGYIFERKQLIPKGLKRGFKVLFKPKKPLLFDNIDLSLDWGGTRAYSEGTAGNIFINLRGRQPQGTVEPGKEYEEVREKIILELKELRDPETGKKVIKSVYKREDLYHGKCIGMLPDLLVICESGYRARGNLKRLGIKSESGDIFRRDVWSGDHRSDGIIMLAGPCIKRDGKIQEANIIDIAPTILYLLGLPIPGGMDGKLLSSAIRTDYLQRQPPRLSDASDEATIEKRDKEEFTREDADKIEERLRSLGYIE